MDILSYDFLDGQNIPGCFVAATEYPGDQISSDTRTVETAVVPVFLWTQAKRAVPQGSSNRPDQYPIRQIRDFIRNFFPVTLPLAERLNIAENMGLETLVTRHIDSSNNVSFTFVLIAN